VDVFFLKHGVYYIILPVNSVINIHLCWVVIRLKW